MLSLPRADGGLAQLPSEGVATLPLPMVVVLISLLQPISSFMSLGVDGSLAQLRSEGVCLLLGESRFPAAVASASLAMTPLDATVTIATSSSVRPS